MFIYMELCTYGVMYTSYRPTTESNPYKINNSNPTIQSFFDCILQNEKEEVKN